LSAAERRDKILQTIGVLILVTQTTERLINSALTLCLADGELITAETLAKDKATYRKATLGRLIKVIKERTDLSEDFDQVLTAFLDDRNTLIHDLQRMGGFDQRSEESLDRMERFLANLNSNMEVVTKVFMSLLFEWSGQVGLAGDIDREKIRRVLGELDGIAGHVFYAKRPSD
jgi:hypothetical protein